MPSFARREVLKLTGATVVGGAATQGVSASRTIQGAEDWSEFQFDSANTGYNPSGTAPTKNLGARWVFSYDLGQNLPHQAPVIAENTVLFQNDTILHALDASSGESRWKIKTETGVNGVPAIADGNVYFRTKDGPLFAVNIEDGSSRWNVPLNSRGKIVPAIANGTIYFSLGGVRALDITDGSLQWKSNIGKKVSVRNSHVYTTTRNKIYALDAESGDTIWESDTTENEGWNWPVVDDEHVYVTDVDHHTVRAFDSTDGSEAWQFQTRGQVNGRSSAAIADGTVYMGDEDGQLYALNSQDGRVIWSVDTGGSIFFSPIVVGDSVFVGSEQGLVIGLNTDDPENQVRFQPTGEPGYYLAYADETVYVTTGENLYAVEEGHTGTGTPEGQGNTETPEQLEVVTATSEITEAGMQDGSKPESNRQRGFFSNTGDEPDFLSDAFNLTMLGFLLSVAGIIHQMLQGR